MDKKYKIRPCKIVDVSTWYFHHELKLDEKFLSDVICHELGNLIVFDIPKPHNHHKDYWIIKKDNCYEIKTE